MRPKPKALDQKQREMWDRVNKYIMQEGGWIVSLPDTKTIRFESPIGSELPELLRQAGHRVFDYGTHERLMPITERIGRTKTVEHVAPGVVGVWQLELPVS
jgi:hypothetical protein